MILKLLSPPTRNLRAFFKGLEKRTFRLTVIRFVVTMIHDTVGKMVDSRGENGEG